MEGDASLEVTPEAEQAVVCPIQVERRDGRGEVSRTTPWPYTKLLWLVKDDAIHELLIFVIFRWFFREHHGLWRQLVVGLC